MLGPQRKPSLDTAGVGVLEDITEPPREAVGGNEGFDAAEMVLLGAMICWPRITGTAQRIPINAAQKRTGGRVNGVCMGVRVQGEDQVLREYIRCRGTNPISFIFGRSSTWGSV